MTDGQRAVFAAAFVAELRNGESRYSAAAAGIDAVIELNLAAGTPGDRRSGVGDGGLHGRHGETTRSCGAVLRSPCQGPPMISLSSLLRSHAYLAGDGTDEQHVAQAREQLDAAVPVLLEIAAAALEMDAFTLDSVRRRTAAERFYAALSKVRQ